MIDPTQGYLTKEDHEILVVNSSRIHMWTYDIIEARDLQDTNREEPPVLFTYPNWRAYVWETTYYMEQYDINIEDCANV